MLMLLPNLLSLVSVNLWRHYYAKNNIRVNVIAPGIGGNTYGTTCGQR